MKHLQVIKPGRVLSDLINPPKTYNLTDRRSFLNPEPSTPKKTLNPKPFNPKPLSLEVLFKSPPPNRKTPKRASGATLHKALSSRINTLSSLDTRIKPGKLNVAPA